MYLMLPAEVNWVTGGCNYTATANWSETQLFSSDLRGVIDKVAFPEFRCIGPSGTQRLRQEGVSAYSSTFNARIGGVLA